MGKKHKVFPEWKLKRPKFTDLKWPVSAEKLAKYDTFELKHDGIWGQMVIDGKSLRIYSRTGQLKMSTGLMRPIFLDRVVIHGEYMFGSNWGIKNGVDRQFFAFDIVEYAAQDVSGLPLSERRGLLKIAGARLSRAGVAIRGATHYNMASINRVWEDKIEKYRYEGLVLKDTSKPFGVGWARIKAQYEIDYVCLGFNLSDAEAYRDKMVSSIIGGLYFPTGRKDGEFSETNELKSVVNVSGLTDAQRAEFFTNPEEFKYRVFTAQGKTVYDNGALRHPNFVGWHAEKTEEECTIASTSAYTLKDAWL